MLPIRFEDIGPDDVLRLLQDKVSERKILEYKEALNIGPDNDRAEFLADVSSFANASGGDIIFGIADERDEGGNATGVPETITPLQLENPVAACSRIEQIIESGVEPRIPVVLVKPIEIPEHGFAIIVRVGKSWLAPHMVRFKNRTRFYSRNGYGKIQLDVQQIGAAFAAQRSIGERLRIWKADRIAKAIAGDGPVPMRTGQILFHFVSSDALTEEQRFPRVFESSAWTREPIYPLMSLSIQYERYNADGYLITSKVVADDAQSYLQIFRDGSLEFGDTYVLIGEEAILGASLEAKIKGTFVRALLLLRKLQVADPIYTSVTLLRVKGRPLLTPDAGPDFPRISEPFDRDIVVSPDVLIQNLSEGQPYPTTLRPIVDSIWQAAGLAQTPFLRQDGIWYDRR